MIKLPPEYITVPAIIVSSKESPAIKDTFIKILGIAQEHKRESRHDCKYTPNLVVDDLITFLDLARRTYFLHIEKLCDLSWLRSETPRIGFVRFSFPIIQKTADNFSAKSCTKVQKDALKEEEEDDLNLINDSSSSSSLSEKSAKSCTKNDGRFVLLRAAGAYPNHIDDILRDETITLEDILAELAHCYDPKSRVRVPSTILGMNLSAGYRAEATYYGSVANIPKAILEHAGLANLIPAPACTPIDEIEVSDKEEPEIIAGADPSLDQVPAGSRMTPAHAWETALEQFRMEMPKSTFDTWISHTRALRYDHNCNILTIGAPNVFTCDWLEDRLKSTTVRQLTGLLNRTIGIEFEVIS